MWLRSCAKCLILPWFGTRGIRTKGCWSWTHLIIAAIASADGAGSIEFHKVATLEPIVNGARFLQELWLILHQRQHSSLNGRKARMKLQQRALLASHLEKSNGRRADRW